MWISINLCFVRSICIWNAHCSKRPCTNACLKKQLCLDSCMGNWRINRWHQVWIYRLAPPPPPLLTTSIPHIEVGFKWMWTLLASPKKNGAGRHRSLRWACSASSSSNPSLSLWILFASCPRLNLEELPSREAPLKAKNRGQSTVSSSIFPAANIVTTMSNLAVKTLVSC